jgi:hypothetical protein
MFQSLPIPVAARSKAWVNRSLPGIVGSSPAGGHGCVSLVSVVYCQVEVSASDWSPVQRSPTECGVSECDREASIMRRPWPTRGCCTIKKKNQSMQSCMLPYSATYFGMVVTPSGALVKFNYCIASAYWC